MTGIPAASQSIADVANFHGTVVDDTGVHGQVHACWPQWFACMWHFALDDLEPVDLVAVSMPVPCILRMHIIPTLQCCSGLIVSDS